MLVWPCIEGLIGGSLTAESAKTVLAIGAHY